MIFEPRIILQDVVAIADNVANRFYMQPTKYSVLAGTGVAPHSLTLLNTAIQAPEQEQVTRPHALVAQMAERRRDLSQCTPPIYGPIDQGIAVDVRIEVTKSVPT